MGDAERSAADVTVLVVDDQELVRDGFAALLAAQPGITVVGTAADGAAAVTRALALAESGRAPDVVLMDVRMPVRNGVEATADIVAAPSLAATRVLVLTTFDLDEHVHAALRAGASGFLLKHATAADLVHAVRVVARGEPLLAPELTRRLIRHYVTTFPSAAAAADRAARLPHRLGCSPRRRSRCSHWSRGAGRTPRWRASSSSPSRPRRAASSPSSACATAPRPSRSPTTAGS